MQEVDLRLLKNIWAAMHNQCMHVYYYTISQLSLTGSGSSCVEFKKCSHASLVTYCNDIHNRRGLYLQLRGWP